MPKGVGYRAGLLCAMAFTMLIWTVPTQVSIGGTASMVGNVLVRLEIDAAGRMGGRRW